MAEIRGVILAGGLGSRLLPNTRVTNKHLLPVYDQPMIYYPVQTLIEAGINDILVVTGGQFAGDFLQLLRNGASLGIQDLRYAYQEGEGGIADALRLAEDFAQGERICVILGDNLVEKSIKPILDQYRAQPKGARIVLKAVEDAERFGVVDLDDQKRITQIIEKPADPPTNLGRDRHLLLRQSCVRDHSHT
jgi:glucose-1-phosphate thymidylyltransferase